MSKNDGMISNEKTNLLFKKLMSSISTNDKTPFYNETAFPANKNIFSSSVLQKTPSNSPTYSQITNDVITNNIIPNLQAYLQNDDPNINIDSDWYNAKSVGNTNTTKSSTFKIDSDELLLRMEYLKLDYINNTNAFACMDISGRNILKNLLPPTFGSSNNFGQNLYYSHNNAELEQISQLGTLPTLPFGAPLIDSENGIVTFYDVDNSNNPVSNFTDYNFYITCTKYVGKKGVSVSSLENPSDGTIALQVNDSGNVGIGTNAPAHCLDIYNNNYIGVKSLLQLVKDYNGTDTGSSSSATFTDIIANIQSSNNPANNAGNQPKIIGLNVDTSSPTNIPNNYTALFNGGNVGIGTTSPSATLEVNGNLKMDNGETTNNVQGARITFDTAYGIAGPNKIGLWGADMTDSYGFGVNAGTLTYYAGANHYFYYWSSSSPEIAMKIESNDVTITGICSADSFNATSDIRFKENIVELENPLQKILSLRAVNYNFKKHPETKHAGVIAQEVEKIIQEAVNKDNDDKWSLNYNTLFSYYIEAMKELNKKIDEKDEEMEKMSKDMEKEKAKTAKLETQMEDLLERINKIERINKLERT